MSDRMASGPLTSSLSRRGAVRGDAAGSAGGRVSAQDADDETLGLSGPDLSAIEFVGKIDQRGADVTFYGFLTHLFAVPASFVSGTEIATATVRLRNVINVQAPRRGLADGTGELAFAGSQRFAFGERELLLGGVGLVQGISYTGQGTLLDPDLPRASLTIAGAIATLG